jgi:hypothetical protein
VNNKYWVRACRICGVEISEGFGGMAMSSTLCRGCLPGVSVQRKKSQAQSKKRYLAGKLPKWMYS